MRFGGWSRPSFSTSLLEALAIFGEVDRIRRGADDRHAVGFQRLRQLQRRLSAVLHDHALGLLEVDDLEHVFERQRLEVQPVGGVVVGRDRLRIAVDHDGFVAILAQRQRGMHAAVVELDALPDAVRAAAEHDDLVARGRLRLAFVLVGRIQVGGAWWRTRPRRNRRACRPAARRTRGADARIADSSVPGRAARGAMSEKPMRLSWRTRLASSAPRPAAMTSASVATSSSIWSRNHGSMNDSAMHVLHAHAGAERIGDVEHAFRIRFAQFAPQFARILPRC